MKFKVKLFAVFTYMVIVSLMCACSGNVKKPEKKYHTINLEDDVLEGEILEEREASNSEETIYEDREDGQIFHMRCMEESFDDCMYKIFLDINSNISDTLMNSMIYDCSQAEELFGFESGDFLKQINFVNDEHKSFFDPSLPSQVFLSTNEMWRDLFLERRSDYIHYVNLFRGEHSRHETYHLLDEKFKFTQGDSIDVFMSDLFKSGIVKKLFRFVYNDVTTHDGFRRKMMRTYGKENLVEVEIDKDDRHAATLTACELFPQIIESLNSQYWETEIRGIRFDNELFSAYKRAVILFRNNIAEKLTSTGYDPDDAPLLKIMDSRIRVMN